MAIEISRIRNIGFVGHGGVGKTSLVEAILFRTGMTSRMDRERADFARTLDSIQRRLKGRFVPLNMPVGQESAFRGVVDVVRMKANVQVAGGKIEEVEVP